jgi:hypothetical protein
MNQQQPQQSSIQQFKGFVSWFAFVCRALAVSVEVFLHRTGTFGERYLGVQSAAAALIIFLYPAFWTGQDFEPLMVFLCAYVFMCACVRAGIVRRRVRGGPQEHSFYTGRPRIMRVTGRMAESHVKAVVEPILVWIVGGFVTAVSEPLGCFLLFAGCGLLVSVNLSLRYDRLRALDMNDALVDQRRIAEQWREMRRD